MDCLPLKSPEMLKGFVFSRSPRATAVLILPPLWHYSAMLWVEFWADPAATAATLPSGLSSDPKSNGHAVMMFLDWQFTAQDDEHADPARYQYREAFVLLDAMHRNAPVMWCRSVFGDNDAALARGWTQGSPKKRGSIFQTRASRLAMALFVLSFWIAIAGRRLKRSCPARVRRTASTGVEDESSAMSAPATNARSPEPVRMAPRMAGSF